LTFEWQTNHQSYQVPKVAQEVELVLLEQLLILDGRHHALHRRDHDLDRELGYVAAADVRTAPYF
jgi:hypothetical protein